MAQLFIINSKTFNVMASRSKILYTDQVTYSDYSSIIDYAEAIKNDEKKLSGGFLKMMLAYVYFFSLAASIIFLLTK
jgi:hypothetical protein